MCSIQLASAAFNIATSIQDYRSKKAIAESTNIANEQTRRNSDQAYLEDIAVIDNERVATSREKVAEEFRINQEKVKKQAQALNLNAGNSDKIIQDIAGTYDLQFLDVTRDYEVDITRMMQKQNEAYAAQKRRYSSTIDAAAPSPLGLALTIGTQATIGYQKHQEAVSKGINNINEINKISAIRTATEGSS